MFRILPLIVCLSACAPMPRVTPQTDAPVGEAPGLIPLAGMTAQADALRNQPDPRAGLTARAAALQSRTGALGQAGSGGDAVSRAAALRKRAATLRLKTLAQDAEG